ncbi:terminase [Selenomonas sp. TAMA-11512]|uniref:terminase n=1 Tax=Selenomonas sp. TAMA-11512 TaxID=3095337 RepID=UPI00308AA5DF|nr:terminase [Selenomonas sp. TAMA-11512]
MTQTDMLALVDALAKFRHDPLRFVLFAFPWGKGELKDKHGPEEWQRKLLADIRDKLNTPDEVIREAVASGHGVGKSAVVAWLILWALSTFPDTRGVVTANTDTQLKTKTWPELTKWYNRFIGKELFVCKATAIFSAEESHQKNWRIDAIPWSESNPEAFAGLHNLGKRTLLVFDEASAIPNIIWEVAEGAMTDANTEIIWAAFGNPTRNTGRFFDCFHRDRAYWGLQKVDSRDVSVSNKAQIQQWIDSRGIDSDFVKVRVLGEFPSASELQFIPRHYVDEARKRKLHPSQYDFAPVIIGIDPAWTGGDELVIVKRQGLAGSILATFSKNDDDFQMANRIAQLEDEHKADGVIIDFGYGTGIYSAGKHLGREWLLVNFAEKSPDAGYVNLRAYGWGRMKNWLREGGVIPNDPQLCDDLIGPETKPREDGKIQLESKESMKKRGLASPNRADAFAITFMREIRKKERDKLMWANGKPYDIFGGE